MIYWIAYLFIKLFSKIYFPCTFIGKENLPKKGGFIIASNHISYLDPVILGISCWRRFSYVAKDDLFKNKLFSALLYQVGAFPIKRESADIGAVKETLRRLKSGCPIIIFPEGTRIAKDKKPQPGIGLIAVKSGVAVIPAFIKGSDIALPPKAKFPKRYPVRVKLGQPIQLSSQDSYLSMAEKILCAIYSLNEK